MKFSGPDRPLRPPLGLGHRSQLPEKDGLQDVAPVEAELDLSQVAAGLLSELGGVGRAGQCSFDCADEGVDRLQFVVEHTGLATEPAPLV